MPAEHDSTTLLSSVQVKVCSSVSNKSPVPEMPNGLKPYDLKSRTYDITDIAHGQKNSHRPLRHLRVSVRFIWQWSLGHESRSNMTSFMTWTTRV